MPLIIQHRSPCGSTGLRFFTFAGNRKAPLPTGKTAREEAPSKQLTLQRAQLDAERIEAKELHLEEAQAGRNVGNQDNHQQHRADVLDTESPYLAQLETG